jgi:hypothetical protein
MVWAYESALSDWKAAHELPYAAHRVLRGHESWKRLRSTPDKKPPKKRADHVDSAEPLASAAE